MEYRSNNIWNRDFIKYIAMATMLLNHISNIFLEYGSFLGELFLDIGYFTAITMCYFMVEGYAYTSSKKKYGLRLLLFAAISEVPYCLAFSMGDRLEFAGMNMIFTLFLCFLIIHVSHMHLPQMTKNLIIVGLILVSIISDWPLLAPIFTWLFLLAKGDRRRRKMAFVIAGAAFFVFNMSNAVYDHSLGNAMLVSLGTVGGIAASGLVLLYLYNGKRMERGRIFSKWFFYIFYPGHLLILGLLRLWIS